MAKQYYVMRDVNPNNLIFLNFSGAVDGNNSQGKRTFAVELTNMDEAWNLANEGYNVKIMDETVGKRVRLAVAKQPTGLPYLPIEYSTRKYIPNVAVKSNGVVTHFTEDMLGQLDNAEFRAINKITIDPSYWETTTGSGIKAYLNELFITLADRDPRDLEFYGISNSDEELPFDEY